ncbi:hypothetical protein P9112_012183 [Eukaryota sp. TZLM1-RC]
MRETSDGNHACAHVAYFFIETALIYPISPSTSMAEYADVLATKGTLNLYDQTVCVRQLQSEAGAAGSLHGALVRGCLASTFTASQGLLLMVPNIYKLTGELLPGVIHVAARSIATHALSIFGDHSDIMAVRQIGCPILFSNNVQEAADIAAVAHIASIRSSLPFIHAFDGKRTSDETTDIDLPSHEDLRTLATNFKTYDDAQKFKQNALDPEHPHMQGTSQDPSVFFQQAESANVIHDEIPQIVEDALKAFKEQFGREYKLYEWYGPSDAEAAIILMGSGTSTVRHALPFLKQNKIGCLSVRLFRPFSTSHFINAIPKTVKRIAVLDKSKEYSPNGEALFTDVATALSLFKREVDVLVGGRYGLSSKDFTPGMVQSVVDNLYSANPLHSFTVGINDDVTHLSLPANPEFSYLNENCVESLFYGVGGDGAVSATHQALEIIVKLAKMHGQLYCFYDAVKNGTTTLSHLRISPDPVDAPFGITHAHYIACHVDKYIHRFALTEKLRENGTFLLNCRYNSLESVEDNFPVQLKRDLAKKNAKLYLINAYAIAKNCGNPSRTNMPMLTAYFKLSGIVSSTSEAIELLKQSVVERYRLKGEKVIDANIKMIEATDSPDAITEIPVPSHWADLPDDVKEITDEQEKREHFSMITGLRGNDLPVSSFKPGGRLEPGTSDWSKRGMAMEIPHWESSLCIQCNTCAYVCPHAVIRPFLLTEEEDKAKPEGMETLPTKGGGDLKKTKFRIQVSSMDCTGCSVCAKSCPAPGCLTMKPAEDERDVYAEYFDYCRSLPNKGDLVSKTSMKGSAFQQPLLEFHGACAGCGETAYVRLLTQLYGDRLVIANGTGCSSIWGGSYPSNPYTVNAEGCGPAWANSLFEDNAEFGLGMLLAQETRRRHLFSLAQKVVNDKQTPKELVDALNDWLNCFEDRDATLEVSKRIVRLLKDARPNPGIVTDPFEEIWNNRTLLDKKSQWMIMGDGASYDIGFGGLDHVLGTGNNLKLLLLDTEVYSNTGGQTSKATQFGAIHKFAMGGKTTFKKDLGRMFFAYENIYVASVSMGANYAQTCKAIKEAEEYPGPAVVICYSPCIEHIYTDGMGITIQNEKLAVDCGYWILYRYDPRRLEKGLNPLQLDSKPPHRHSDEFLDTNGRFRNMKRQFPEKADKFRSDLHQWLKRRWNSYSRMAMPWDDQPTIVAEPVEEAVSKVGEDVGKVPKEVTKAEPGMKRKLEGQLLLAWGSETGTVEEYQEVLVDDLRKKSIEVVSKELNSVSIEDLKKADLVFVMVSSTGGGEVPGNAEEFVEEMKELAENESGVLDGVRFCLFGFGAKSYADTYQFGPLSVFNVLTALGATPVLDRGEGDSDAQDGIDETLKPWMERFYETFVE